MANADLTPEMIRYAYERGYFPMADGLQGPIHWYYPTMRCLMPMEGIRVSRSLRRTLRMVPFEITFDQKFEEVMRACQRPTDNWISEDLIAAYVRVHEEGWAHSCEVWLDGQLVGGLYGVAIGACFCGESMFSRVTDASKVALVHLIPHLRQLGFELFDAQFINPHTASLGAFEITQLEYLTVLHRLMRKKTPWS